MASLSVGKLKALVNPGRHGDGDGLYLNNGGGALGLPQVPGLL